MRSGNNACMTERGAAPRLSLLDWRRRVAALYAEVRRAGDPRKGHRIWIDGRHELLATHPESPIPAAERARFEGVLIAPYDPDLRFVVEIAAPDLDGDAEPGDGPRSGRRTWEVATATDGVVPFSLLGVASLPGIGDLDVWWLESYGGGVFLPLKDRSVDTYGGGRYVLDTVKGADLGGDASRNRLVLDLNFAYNPSCAYDPAWACPLAPVGNTVDMQLPGGERMSS
jgi:uncharacterized protein (DUF1684 family)